MSKKLAPDYISVKGLLLKRIDAPAPGSTVSPPPKGLTVWHIYVTEADTSSRFSPDAGHVVEEESHPQIVAEVMALEERMAKAAMDVILEQSGKASSYQDKWTTRGEKGERKLPYEKAVAYIKEGWNNADKLVNDLRTKGFVVLEDNVHTARTAASPKKGFTVEEAERVATEIGLDLSSVAWDAEQFRKGMDVELEHGKLHSNTDVTNDDPRATGKIAWAHLREIPDYYDRLAQMEQGGKAELAEKPEASKVRVVQNEDTMDDKPKYVSINGNVYRLAKDQTPDRITVRGRTYRKMSGQELRSAKKGLPKGWTDESAKESWKTTKKEAPAHPVTHCIEQLEGNPDIDDPGALCAWRADKGEGTGWRRKKKKKSPKKARIDYMLPDNHPQLPMQYNKPVQLEGIDVGRLQEAVHRGGTSPSYALLSRLNAYGTTVASDEELEDTIDALEEYGTPEALDAAEQLQRA